MSERFFESIKVGDKVESARYTFTEQAIMEYCAKYDPQSFHIDRKEAAQSIFGSIVASGFHTLAVAFRLFMELGLFGRSNLGGFAIDGVRLLKPVRGGDEIRVKSEIVEARVSQSKPDRGVVYVRHEVLNQDDAVVVHFTIGHLVRRQPTCL